MKRLVLMILVIIFCLAPIGCTKNPSDPTKPAVKKTPTPSEEKEEKLGGKFLVINDQDKLLLLDNKGNLIKEVDVFGEESKLKIKVYDDNDCFVSEELVEVTTYLATYLSPDAKGFCCQKCYFIEDPYFKPLVGNGPSKLLYVNAETFEVKEIICDNNLRVDNIQWLSNDLVSFVVFDLTTYEEELYTFNVKLNEQTHITTLTRSDSTRKSFYGRYVLWSPDQKMFFDFFRSYSGSVSLLEIYTLKEDGKTNVVTVPTSFTIYPISPFWSADGKKILFADKSYAITSVNSDGTELKKVFPGQEEDFEFLGAYGEKIVYFNSRRESYWIANNDGSNPVLITDQTGIDKKKEIAHLSIEFLKDFLFIQREVRYYEYSLNSYLYSVRERTTYFINKEGDVRIVDFPDLYEISGDLYAFSPNEKYFIYGTKDRDYNEIFCLFDFETNQNEQLDDFYMEGLREWLR